MDFAPNADQIALNSALDKLAARFTSPPTDFRTFTLVDPALTQALEQGGFFDAAQIPELGPVSAAMMVERLARLPYAAEVALSMLVKPQLKGEHPGPFAVMENPRPGRFVAEAKTLLVLDGDQVSIFHPAPDTVESVDSLYA